GNLGAVLRTADGAGAAAVGVLDPSCDIYNPNVVRACLGALFSVAVIQCGAHEFEAFCKNRGVKVIATTPHTSSLYYDVDMRGATAILMGSEALGLSNHWLDR